MPAGLPRIEVKFLIDANGILHVSAREQRSGKEAEIEVKPTYGLTDEQVENMILDSFDNAEEDFRARQVIEARNEAATILAALGKGRRSPIWDRLDRAERERISRIEQQLLLAQNSDDYRVIQAKISELNEATTRLAELMMDSAVSSALKGKNLQKAGLEAGPTAPHPFAPAEIEETK